MIFRIDTSSEQPYFEQIAAQVRLAIIHGRLGQGTRLPAAGDVADALGLNHHTVLHAYQVLRDEGLITLRRGQGAQVATAPDVDPHDLRRAVGGFVDRARALGLSPEAAFDLVREEWDR